MLDGKFSLTWPMKADMSRQAPKNELIDAVERAAGLSHEQASAAVDSMLRFLASRFPSPLFGQIQDRLIPERPSMPTSETTAP